MMRDVIYIDILRSQGQINLMLQSSEMKATLGKDKFPEFVSMHGM